MNFSGFMSRFLTSFTSNEVLWQHEVEGFERLFPQVRAFSKKANAASFQDKYHLLYPKVYEEQTRSFEYLMGHRVADEGSRPIDVYEEISRLKEYFERSTIVRRKALLTRWNTLIAIRQITDRKSVVLKGLTEVPEKLVGLLSRFNDLRSLEFQYCAFEVLPESVSRLVQLETLLISNTCLGELPINIGSLTGLTSLVLADNAIGSVPESLRFLHSLRHLSLSGNNLTSLPSSEEFDSFLNNLNLDRASILEQQASAKVDTTTWPEYWALRLAAREDLGSVSA